MGRVVVVVVVLLLVKTFTHVFKSQPTQRWGVGSWNPKYQGIQPRRKFYMRSQHLGLTGLGKVSRLSSGLDPQISRDPTPKKVLYAKSAPMSDMTWRGVKIFFRVGSLNIKGSNPEENLYAKSGPMSDMSWLGR